MLLDTPVLLWWLADSSRLTSTARDIVVNETNEVLVSAASAWEISTKMRKGNTSKNDPSLTEIMHHVTQQGFLELPINMEDAKRAGRLPETGQDPFDRMLASQALLRNLVLLSADEGFDYLGVNRVW